MLTPADLQEAFRAVSSEIRVEIENADRCIVHVPDMFDDGEHFVVILKRNWKPRDERWLMTDEGHTLRKVHFGSALNIAPEIPMWVSETEPAETLRLFIQRLTRIRDGQQFRSQSNS